MLVDKIYKNKVVRKAICKISYIISVIAVLVGIIRIIHATIYNDFIVLCLGYVTMFIGIFVLTVVQNFNETGNDNE